MHSATLQHALDHVTLELECDATFSLSDPRGLRVVCLAGALWLTQDDDRHDIILEPGQSHTLERAGKAVLLALRAARFALEGP